MTRVQGADLVPAVRRAAELAGKVCAAEAAAIASGAYRVGFVVGLAAEGSEFARLRLAMLLREGPADGADAWLLRPDGRVERVAPAWLLDRVGSSRRHARWSAEDPAAVVLARRAAGPSAGWHVRSEADGVAVDLLLDDGSPPWTPGGGA
jgi:hypothetical protein